MRIMKRELVNMQQREKRTRLGLALSIIMAALGLLLAIGSRTLFTACSAQEDGSYMACHWAEMASSALGAVIAVQGLIALLLRDRKAQGAVFAAAAPAGLLCCFIPGTVISICSMSGMHCRTNLRPWVIVLGAVICAVALIGAAAGLHTKHEED